MNYRYNIPIILHNRSAYATFIINGSPGQNDLVVAYCNTQVIKVMLELKYQSQLGI